MLRRTKPKPTPPAEPVTGSDVPDATTASRETPAAADAEKAKPARVVTAKRPHGVWHCDISAIPIGLPGAGYWTAWWPFSIVLAWVLSWHIVLVLDHFSRALLAFRITRREPSAADVCAALDDAVARAGVAPRHIVTDCGSQFATDYLAWCTKHGARPRFGAVGKHGSIAILERMILSLKQEFLRRIFVPSSYDAMVSAMSLYAVWYNEHRPHASLDGRTPREMLDGVPPPRLRERFEPRPGCTAERAKPKDDRERAPPVCRPRGELRLVVSYVGGHRELPIVELHDAA
jgi:transposase InsO family protein